jgi:lipopolysaccharide transport system ATP-binding protein
VSDLPRVVASFDSIVIGVGHLIRFDKEVAPGYFPPCPDLHHPTAYWLFPALLALEARVPLIWSTVGASPELPEWGRDLLRETLNHSAYVSVRDDTSHRVLKDLGSSTEVFNVPDSAFGIRELCLGKMDSGRAGRPYVAIQATPNLKANAEPLKRLVSWLTSQDIQVRSLPVAPVLGDDPEVVKEIIGKPFAAAPWIDPMDAVKTIANAATVVGVSLHLSITALAFGVPILRPFQNALSKYTPLHNLSGVFQLESYLRESEAVHRAILSANCRSAEIDEFYVALIRHWDRIAEIVTNPPKVPERSLVSLLQKLPFWLENAHAPQVKSRSFW